MKKITVSISCDEEKLSALKMYLAQKEMQVETELEKAFDTLYSKTVPAGVREFIDMKSGTAQSKTIFSFCRGRGKSSGGENQWLIQI